MSEVPTKINPPSKDRPTPATFVQQLKRYHKLRDPDRTWSAMDSLDFPPLWRQRGTGLTKMDKE